ncbi:MAG: LysR substrate-binding domain-containing protein [Sulfitobacter sp.]
MSWDLKSLELFVRVAAVGALGRAGEEFQLSPTATTQRIQVLETSLGTKLLNRTTRAISLTPDGELFLEHAKLILNCVEDANTALSTKRKHISGELRVTASASFGRSQIVPYVGEFLEKYPDIRLKLNLSDTVVDIVEHGYDLAIRVGSLTSSSLLARKLAPNPRVLVASPFYLEARGTPVLPADLKKHNCIVLGETRTWSLEDKQGNPSEVRVSGSFTTNAGEAVTDATLQGLGIGLKSVWDVNQHLANGQLISVLPDYSVLPDWQIWAVRPPNRIVPVRVQAFSNFLEEKFKEIRLGQ